MRLLSDRIITDIINKLNVSQSIESLTSQTKISLTALLVALCFNEFPSIGHQMGFIAIDGNKTD